MKIITLTITSIFLSLNAMATTEIRSSGEVDLSSTEISKTGDTSEEIIGEVKATGKETIVISLKSDAPRLSIGTHLSSEEKDTYVLKAIDGRLLVLGKKSAQSPKLGTILKLKDDTELKAAEEVLKKYESLEASKGADSYRAENSILDLDFFTPHKRVYVELGSKLILKDKNSATDSTGVYTLEEETKGTDVSMKAEYSPISRLSIYGIFNYVPKKKEEGGLTNGTKVTSEYKGVDDPNFGLSFRLKEKKHSNDFSATAKLDFEPALAKSQNNTKGKAAPGKGYALTMFSTDFNWKWEVHELGITPTLIYATSGGTDGVDGGNNLNIDSTFTGGVAAKYQNQVHKDVRLIAGLGFLLPFSREVEVLGNPRYFWETENVVTFIFGVGASATPFQSKNWIAKMNLEGFVPSGDSDVTIRRPSNGAQVSGKAKIENWSLNIAFGKLF